MMQVIMNLYSAHMDPDDWQQPQQFRPERFLDESGNVIGKDRVIPFSLGKLSITYGSSLILFDYERHYAEISQAIFTKPRYDCEIMSWEKW